jgi:hypothetical protein
MGSEQHYPEEAPARTVAAVDGFWIDPFQVTNRRFTAFVDDTGYVTVAERPLRDEAAFERLPLLRMSELLDFALIRRLREVRERTTPATESELRVLTEQAEAWARTVDAQIHSSEHRIASLNSNPASSLAQIAGELRRVETLRPQLREVQSLLSDLENRARELRTQWLLTQATSTGATTRRPSGRRS